ncbi:MAG: hypothetical protein RJA70_2908, partial [Pseudomonadota bacterium]
MARLWRPLRDRALTVVPALLIAVSGCTGELGGPTEELAQGPSGLLPPAVGGNPKTGPGPGPGPGLPVVTIPPPLPPADCNPQAGFFVAPSTVRRLSIEQYNRAALDVLGDTSSPANTFPAAARTAGFDNQTDAQQVQREHVERWESAAQGLARRAAASGDLTLGCGGEPLDTCVQNRLPTLASRLFRRPLTPTEVERYVNFYSQQRQTESPEVALELTLAGLLMSPNFLFVIERGVPTGSNGLFRLNGYEVASRLALMLWDQPPTEPLLAAATAGELETPEGIAARARTMLADPRATHVVQDFHGQWIGLHETDKLALPEATKDAAKAEIEWFLRDWYETGTARVQDLFLSRRAWVDAELAQLYGVAAPAQPGPVELPAQHRAGLLTRVMFLGTHSIPPSRGSFVLDKLLCAPLPPLDVMPPSAQVAEGSTTREFFEQNAKNPCASGCHGLVDPVGFTFENYDRLGVWRDDE